MSLTVVHCCLNVELGLVRKLAVNGEMVRHNLMDGKLIFMVLHSQFIWSNWSFFAQVSLVNFLAFSIGVAYPGVAQFLLLGVADELLPGIFELDCH
jgi:hypothetical protein